MLRGLCATGLILWATVASSQSTEPLSAIDWLSQSVQIPVTSIRPEDPSRNEPPVVDSAVPPQVTTTPLDTASPDSIGLLSPSVTDLPRGLWAGSDEATLITLLRAVEVSGLPAKQDLLKTLLLAEADPPAGASSAGALFQARVDKLLDLGAIEEAQALLEQARIESPDLFRRWFDVALLIGTEDQACQVMQRRIDVAPTYAARIFCLARGGDWAAAALSLNTHIALGDLSAKEEGLLARFLDPELFEGEPPLGPPDRVSPLLFRMYEAIGERLNTSNLPRAFAHADLRPTVGWKSQIEAAERLTRHGALSPNVLFALYTARTPSASGGVWDRASAFQAFDRALRRGDAGAVAASLPGAWAAAREAQIEVGFALEYGAALAEADLPGAAGGIAAIVAALTAEVATPAQSPIDVLAGLDLKRDEDDPLYGAIVGAWAGAPPPAMLIEMATTNRLGEALLRSIALIEAGAAGDSQSLTDALAFLNAIGMETTAHRVAAQTMLLERDM